MDYYEFLMFEKWEWTHTIWKIIGWFILPFDKQIWPEQRTWEVAIFVWQVNSSLSKNFLTRFNSKLAGFDTLLQKGEMAVIFMHDTYVIIIMVLIVSSISFTSSLNEWISIYYKEKNLKFPSPLTNQKNIYMHKSCLLLSCFKYYMMVMMIKCANYKALQNGKELA